MSREGVSSGAGGGGDAQGSCTPRCRPSEREMMTMMTDDLCNAFSIYSNMTVIAITSVIFTF